MSRWKRKKQKWLIARAIRLSKKKHKKKKRNSTRYITSDHDKHIAPKPVVKPEIVIKTVPKVFSLTLNTEETMAFISDLIAEIKHKQFRKTIIIDSAKVEIVTVDALIYLIAIMQNNTINREMQYVYKGNFPENQEANRVYQESGFTDYVKSKIRKFPASNEKKRICYGKLNDSKQAAEFCMFVGEHFNKGKTYTIPLQKVLIELMSNVAHHAYEQGNPAMAHNWYLYAEHEGSRIRFVFVDTGLGIVNTVRKKISERIFTFFGSSSIEGDILRSVFLGDFQRTETKLRNRGNGLKTVYEDVLKGPFENFNVVTGKGLCSINRGTQSIMCKTYGESLPGTLFTFDYVLEEDNNGSNKHL